MSGPTGGEKAQISGDAGGTGEPVTTAPRTSATGGVPVGVRIILAGLIGMVGGATGMALLSGHDGKSCASWRTTISNGGSTYCARWE